MWTRAELKMRGKEDFKRNYWTCVLVSLVLAILLGSGGASGGRAGSKYIDQNSSGYSGYLADDDSDFSDNPVANAVLNSVVISVLAVVGLITIVFGIFVGNPLIVGGRRFYLENQQSSVRFNLLGYVFKKDRYGNTVLALFLKNLYIGLWTCLFIVPGIIKSYSYWMMEYILAENPTLNQKRAFEISKQTMNGQKWNVFVLDISFILWYLLSGITCGLVGLFYVNSYADATKARLYTTLRENALTQGFATADELPGYFPQAAQDVYQ